MSRRIITVNRGLTIALLLAIASCSFFASGAGSGWGTLHETAVVLSGAGGTCTVTSFTKITVQQNDVVRWKLDASGDGCKNKDFKIGKKFTACGNAAEILPSPFILCGSAKTGDLSKKPKLLCGIRDEATPGCYRFEFVDESEIDPEIEIDKPRFHLWELLFRLLALFGLH